jgi:hypothetical protein
MIRATRDDFSSSVDVHSLACEAFPCHECPVPTGREFYDSGLFLHKLLLTGTECLLRDLCWLLGHLPGNSQVFGVKRMEEYLGILALCIK